MVRRSRLVSVSLFALLTSACDDDNDVKRCIDNATQKVIDDKYCRPGDGGVTSVTSVTVHEHASSPAIIYHPVWYYGGGGFEPGWRVYGGSTMPSVGRSYYAPSAFKSGVVRGGFGTSAHASFGG